MIEYAAEIRARYGNVRRARGCWLYTEKNTRLLDMFLDGGAALLGRRGGKAKLVLKNALDRGLGGALPSGAEKAFASAVRALFGTEGGVSWFRSKARAETACAAAGFTLHEWFPWGVGSADAVDPKAVAGSGGAVCFPVPFPWGAAPDFSGVAVFFPGFDSVRDFRPNPRIHHMNGEKNTAGENGAATGGEAFAPELSRGDSVPPPLLWAFARAVYDLRRKLQELHDDDFAEAFAAIQNSVWRRKGAYLFLKEETCASVEAYHAFFSMCLDKGVLVSPFLEIPSAIPLPCVSSPQELLSLKTVLKKIPLPENVL